MEGWGELEQAYSRAVSPIVSNWRGRNILSWFLLKDRSPRLVFQSVDQRLFEYGRIPVIQANRTESALNTAMRVVEAQGECWVFLAFLEAKEAEHARRALERVLARAPGLSLTFVRWGIPVDVPVVVARLVPRSSGGPAF